MVRPRGEKTLVKNRRARYDYSILETYEAGISLLGTEVKSIRNGRANIAEAHAQIVNMECFLFNMHISPYAQGNQFNHDPVRPRRLLLNKREINKLFGKTQLEGNTIIPLRVYLKNGWVKVEIAVARGKKLYDKREDTAKRDAQRRAREAAKANERGY